MLSEDEEQEFFRVMNKIKESQAHSPIKGTNTYISDHTVQVQGDSTVVIATILSRTQENREGTREILDSLENILSRSASEIEPQFSYDFEDDKAHLRIVFNSDEFGKLYHSEIENN